MKKFFLIPLVALFTCVNVWADAIAKVEVDGQAGETQIDSLATLNETLASLSTTDTIRVTLLDSIVGSDGNRNNVTLTIPADKKVVLNLAGWGIKQNWNWVSPVHTLVWNTTENGGTYTTASINSALNDYVGTGTTVDNYTPQQAYNYTSEFPFGPKNPLRQYTKCGDCDKEDINFNSLIYNMGVLRITSVGNAIVQMNISATGGSQATTICNAGHLTIDGGIFIGPRDAFKLPVVWHNTSEATTIINGGTFLCDESVSDFNNGPDFGPIHGSGNWTINGGVFSTNEMAGALSGKTSTKTWFLEDYSSIYHLGTNSTAIEVPYSNANIKGYSVDYRHNQYYSYIKDNPGVNEQVGNDAATARENGDTIHNGICPDPVKMGQTQGNKKYYNYADRSTANGSISYWVTEDSARNKIYYQRYRYAVKPVCMVVPSNGNILNVTSSQSISGLVEKDYVNVAAGATLTIPAGATLKVGNAGVVLSDETAKIEILPGGTLISDNDIVTAYNDNIELTMDATNTNYGKYAHLLIKAGNIQAKHPNATVHLKSVAKGLTTWQRFAIPTYQSDFTIADIERPAGVGTAFFKWQYDGEDGNWVQLTSAEAVLEPFHGYIMTNNAEEAGQIYTFKGELVGNGNPRLSLQKGWNYFANSYTAPISVEAMLVGMKAKLDGEAAVWVQRNGAKNTWSDIAYADIKDGGINEALLLLQPMNTFVFKASAVSTFDLEYDDFVYTPVKSAKGFAPRKAPAAAQDEDYKMAVIVLTDEEEDEELLRLYEGNDFSDSFDNGYDVSKMLNEEIFNAYFVSPALGNLSRLASDNVDNASITLATAETTNFTLSFRNVSLEGYALKDNVADSLITISDEATYEFVAVANTKYEGRFTVVKTEDPTAIEDVEDTKHITNGIYTVTGVYVGNNINMLPAGVYIINGKKVVK